MEMEERALQLVEESKNKSLNIVQEQKETTLNEIKESDEFKEAAKQLYQKSVQEDFKAEAIKIRNHELQNEYDLYALDKKKELLDLQVKYEKGLVKEQVKAEIQQQKIATALKRYGYLTPLFDENGNAIKDEKGNVVVDMQKFTPNKMSNRFKELEYNYNNMSKTARKIIWTSLKTLIFTGVIFFAGWVIYKFLIPFLQTVQI